MGTGAPGVAPFYYTANGVLWSLLRVLSHWHVHGREAVPRHGPLIVVANHLSHLDPPLLATSLPRRVAFLAKQELLAVPIAGRCIRAYGVVTVNRGQDFRSSMARLKELLGQDRAVAIFPEGTRSRGGGLQRAKLGVAMLAAESQAPILPVAITGTERVRNLRGAFTHPRITVTIGEAFTLPVVQGSMARAQFTSLTDMIMGRVAALLPPGYRGEYAAQARDAVPTR